VAEEEKPKKRVIGRPFEKGDPRIRRDGKRKDTEALLAWGREQFNEDILRNLFALSKRKDSVGEKAGYDLWCILNGKPRQAVELTGAGGAPIQFQSGYAVWLRTLNNEELARLQDISRAAAARDAEARAAQPGGVAATPERVALPAGTGPGDRDGEGPA